MAAEGAPQRHVRDVGDADFAREVIARSADVPVVVDFWAPWCGPCRALGPLLERLAEEHHGAFVLAKVNVDEAPGVAQQFGVRSIPLVVGFREGRAAAQFVGAQSEGVVRQFLRELLPSEADALVTRAEALADDAEAVALLRTALGSDPHHARARLALARRLGDAQRDEALALLDGLVGPPALEQQAARLAATLRMRTGSPAALESLRAAAEAQPDDLGARIAWGRALAGAGRSEEALEVLLAAVDQDPAFDDGAARRAMLDVFEVLGPEHPLTERFRRALAGALFR